MMNRRGFLKGLVTATVAAIAGKAVVAEKIVPLPPVVEDSWHVVTLTWTPGIEYKRMVADCVKASPLLQRLPPYRGEGAEIWLAPDDEEDEEEWPDA